MLMTTMKSDLITSMKEKNEVKKNILRVVLGEVSTLESRSEEKLTEEQISKVIRKIIQANEETLRYGASEKLESENKILNSLLPKTLCVSEIRQELVGIPEIKEAKSEGQAVGIAIKYLKGKQLTVLGEDVKSVVLELRN